jgi:hypothetical protein
VNLSVRPVDLRNEQEELIAVLQRNLPDVQHSARFSWLYRNNPSGAARSWFLYDRSDKVVGVTSLFPRTVWINNTAMVCGQVGDFGVDSQYRSLGPALLLQRATFQPVRDGEMAFCYDCPPHERGMAMFYRIGLQENCRMQAYVKPLRMERQLCRMLGDRGGTVAAKLVDPILSLRFRGDRTSSSIEFALHNNEFSHEFTACDQSLDNGTIRHRRTAEDLKWRYRDNPLRKFDVLTARKNGELLGYVVFSAEGEDALIFDLFGEDLARVGPLMLQAITDLARLRHLHTIRALLSQNCSYRPIFEQAGFYPRDHGPRIVAFSVSHEAWLRSASWHFQQTDVMA